LRGIRGRSDKIVQEELTVFGPAIRHLRAACDDSLFQALILVFQCDGQGIRLFMVFSDADRLRFIPGIGYDQIVSAIGQPEMKTTVIF
jgi:hypothetical protein